MKLKLIIIKMLDSQFELTDSNTVFDKFNDGVTTPNDIQQEIINCFNLNEQGAYLIVFEWLYNQGMESIQLNWFKQTYHNYGSGDVLGCVDLTAMISEQVAAEIDREILDNIRTIENEHNVTWTVSPNNSDVTYITGTTSTTYFMGCDTATRNDSECTVIQMNPNYHVLNE